MMVRFGRRYYFRLMITVALVAFGVFTLFCAFVQKVVTVSKEEALASLEFKWLCIDLFFFVIRCTNRSDLLTATAHA
jgi:hypothetical protein